MFVKVIKKYNDLTLNTTLPEGLVYQVTEERGKVLIDAKVCEEYKIEKVTTKSKKVETPEKENLEEEVVNSESTAEPAKE